jgi:Flp pilus assembly protein TadG
MAPINLRQRLACDQGAELIEFALVFPLLLLVLFGIMDLGFLFQRYEVLTNAAREGARVAILDGYTKPDIEARVKRYLTDAGLSDAPSFTYNAGCGDIPCKVPLTTGKCVTMTGVTVEYPFQFQFLGNIIGLFGGSGFTTTNLKATALMRSEAALAGC